ncbi:Ig-like domain-containing domain [Fusibacter bizertensis]
MKKLTAFLILILLFNVQVFASNGGGGDNALSLETSTPATGAVDVSLEPEIVLTFSNNVANASVSESNIAAIKMVDQNNSLVALNIEVHDDQIFPDDKRLIFIKPTAPLLPLTQYTIIISPEVTSKNGSKIGEEVKISFTTLGESVATTEPTSSEAPTTVEETTIVATTVVETTLVASTELENNTSDNQASSTVTIIVILGIVVVAGIAYTLIKKSKK